MPAKSLTVHEEKEEITVIELHSFKNCLPVSPETFLRILHGLAVAGYITLPGKISSGHLFDK